MVSRRPPATAQIRDIASPWPPKIALIGEEAVQHNGCEFKLPLHQLTVE